MNPSISGMRNAKPLAILGIVLCCANFSTVGLVHSQDLDIESPSLAWPDPSYDYGNVEVGGSKAVTFDLLSKGPTAVWVYVIGLSEAKDYTQVKYPPDYYALGSFSLDPTDPVWDPAAPPALPMETPTGTHIPFDVFFTPAGLGSFNAYLFIQSNDSVGDPGTTAFIQLKGTGVEAVPEPSSMLLLGLSLMGLVGVKRMLR